MNLKTILAFSTLFLLPTAAVPQKFDSTCPRTIGTDGPYADSWPKSETWFGSERLAVVLPKDGIWPTTKPPARLSVKLFWYIEGFKAGHEQGFVGSVRRLDEGINDADMYPPTNAGGSSLGAWTVLTGIDFPSEGCWQVTGEYEGTSLSFIVETIPYDRYHMNAT